MVLDEERDIIKRIYYENNVLIENSKEYKAISKKIRKLEVNILDELRKLEVNILDELSEKGKKDFESYLEYVLQRESIDAENEFEKGFKIAVKIIIESLK